MTAERGWLEPQSVQSELIDAQAGCHAVTAGWQPTLFE